MENLMDRDFLPPEPMSTPHGTIAFRDETWSIDPRELQIFFQAEEVYWTADRTICPGMSYSIMSRAVTMS